MRSFRMGKTWDEAAAVAHDRDENLRDVVELALRRYIQRYRKAQTKDAPPA